MSHGLMFNILVYLAAAVIVVPVSRRLGLGSVLGYLLAGICIGPWGLGLISNTQDILHFSEFGVVLLLFLVGLELNPARLWNMRRSIVSAGILQIIVTTLLLTTAGHLIGWSWPTAFIAGFAFSLSSTAIALQTLSERHQLSTPAGATGFAILLLQDIAVIPVIAIMPLMASLPHVSSRSPLENTLYVVAAIAIIIFGGRYLMRKVFRFVASTQAREIFTALSLLLVFGIAALMQYIGMSMALGTFLGGVLLADSEYRHQLETDIEPFKGLLMGLFFISVGMIIDFGVLAAQPWLVTTLVLGLLLIKILALRLIAQVNGIPANRRWFFAFLLSQGGEFAFVVFSTAHGMHIIEPEIANILTVSVALSMLATPVLLQIDSRIIQQYYQRRISLPPEDVIDEQNSVIVAGFGRFGQIVSRLLIASKVSTTVIDHNPEHIERIRRFGLKVFYGDATRMDLLESAGIARASLLVLAFDDWSGMVRTARAVRQQYPHIRILARAWDMIHAYELLDADVKLIERDTFESALQLGCTALQELGFSEQRALRLTHKFRQHDIQSLYKIYAVHHDEKLRITRTLEARQDLIKLFEEDEQEAERDENRTEHEH